MPGAELSHYELLKEAVPYVSLAVTSALFLVVVAYKRGGKEKETDKDVEVNRETVERWAKEIPLLLPISRCDELHARCMKEIDGTIQSFRKEVARTNTKLNAMEEKRLDMCAQQTVRENGLAASISSLDSKVAGLLGTLDSMHAMYEIILKRMLSEKQTPGGQ